MPNWCDSHMTIYGPADKVIDFVAGVETMEAPSFLKKYVPLNADDPEFWDYDLANEKWGTKWGDCSLSMPTSEKLIAATPDEHGNLTVTVNFDTAWGPAEVGLIALSQRWPTLVFGLTFNEQGMDFMGSVIFVNGDEDVLLDANIPRLVHPYMFEVDTFEADPYETQHDRFMEWLYWQYRFVQASSVSKWQEVFNAETPSVPAGDA